MSVKIKNRHRLKTKDIKKFQNELKNTFNSVFFNEKSSVEMGDFEGIKIIFVDGEPCFMFHENKIVFTLYGLNRYKPKQNFVVVDMGAVPHIANGADVMAPGIVELNDSINEGDLVVVIDQRNRTPLAVGRILKSAEEVQKMEKGRAIETLHHVGDPLWELIKTLST